MPGVVVVGSWLRRKLVADSPCVTRWRFYFYNVRAKIRQDHRSRRPRDETRQVHDLQSREDVFSCHKCLLRSFVSPSLELRCTLFEKCGSSFLLVFCCGAETEERGLERQTFGLSRFQSLVHRLKRVFDGDGSVGKNLFQDRFGARDQIGGGDNLVDQAYAMSFGCVDYPRGKNELKGPSLPDQSGQALRTASARKEAQFHFRLTELCVLCGDPDGARHRSFAATAERKPVDCRDHRLTEILDEVQDRLAKAAGPFCFHSSNMSEFADIGSSDEGLIAGP